MHPTLKMHMYKNIPQALGIIDFWRTKFAENSYIHEKNYSYCCRPVHSWNKTDSRYLFFL